MKKHLLLLIVLCATGCASVATSHRPNADYYNSATYPRAESTDDEPFFGTTEGLLSDEDIERILNYRLKLPDTNRIAILKLSSDSYWRNYSNDFAQLNQSIVTDFVDRLRASPRVYDASFLPSMLVPEKRTAPYLREAAARYQADLLLAYRSKCRTFEKYKFLDPNETKAYCSIEAVLLDVRSGIVAFTVISTNEFSSKKEQGDTNFQETKKRAEMAALGLSLAEVASELRSFLTDIDTL